MARTDKRLGCICSHHHLQGARAHFVKEMQRREFGQAHLWQVEVDLVPVEIGIERCTVCVVEPNRPLTMQHTDPVERHAGMASSL